MALAAFGARLHRCCCKVLFAVENAGKALMGSTRVRPRTVRCALSFVASRQLCELCDRLIHDTRNRIDGFVHFA